MAGIGIALEHATLARPREQFNQIEMHTRHHDVIREASATARKAETDQAASQTEAKAVETRTGAGRETDTTTAIETETANVAETATGSTQ